jgi:hypothetical protein
MYTARPTSSPSNIIIFTSNISMEAAEFVSWMLPPQKHSFSHLTDRNEYFKKANELELQDTCTGLVLVLSIYIMTKKTPKTWNSVGVHY